MTEAVNIEPLVRAMGIKNVRTINPNQLSQVNEALDWALGMDEQTVIITRWPCALKKQAPWDLEEFRVPLPKPIL